MNRVESATAGAGKSLEFTKMSGGGNDFIMVDNRTGIIRDPSTFCRLITTRRLSAGADGLILIETSPRATFRMRYYNSDGSPADFCANGTRCAARFAFLNVVAPRKMTIDTDAGVIGAEIGEKVTLSLPSPRDFQVRRPLTLEKITVHGSSIRVGVPHYVLFLTDTIWRHDIVPVGARIRNHQDLQPDGANVNFVVVRDRHSIDVRTYERGVEGETLSCGSGVVASVTVSALLDRVDSPVSVLTRSGIRLEVSFSRSGTSLENVKLSGDARVVYRATTTPDTVEGFDPEWVANPTETPAVT